MPVHSLLITTPDGRLIFSKYFDYKKYMLKENSKLFEKQVLMHTQRYWKNMNTTLQSIIIRYSFSNFLQDILLLRKFCFDEIGMFI